MKEYRVELVVMVEASSPEAAADKAIQKIIRDKSAACEESIIVRDDDDNVTSL